MSRSLILALILTASQVAAPTEEDWTWLNDHRDKAFDALMPLRTDNGEIVAYRSYRSLYQDVLESHFSIAIVRDSGPRGDRLTATLTLPANGSIQNQLLKMHMADRKAPVETLLARVIVDRRSLTEENCPALRSRVKALSRTRIDIPDPNTLVLHPEVHTITVDMLMGQINARLMDSRNSMVRWAVDTLKALRACHTARHGL